MDLMMTGWMDGCGLSSFFLFLCDLVFLRIESCLFSHEVWVVFCAGIFLIRNGIGGRLPGRRGRRSGINGMDRARDVDFRSACVCGDSRFFFFFLCIFSLLAEFGLFLRVFKSFSWTFTH